MNLKNKTAIITGASQGIGKQIALKLAKQGTNLALISRTESNLKEVAKQASKLGAKKVQAYPCDIRNTEKLTQTIKSIAKDFKQINILINCAGIWQKMMPIEKVKPVIIDDVIQTNLTSLIHATNLILPHLKTQKDAAIINVSSKSGVTAQAGQSVYTASKWGVRGFTETLKADLKGTHIRVAGIYQSGTNTQMFHKTGETPPLEKFTNPADLADTIVYILSRPPKIWIHEIRVEY